MFYLSTQTAPTNAHELARAIEGGLREALTLPAGRSVVRLSGNYPELDALAIDLTSCRVDPARRLPPPRGVGPSQPAVTAKQLRVTAAPLLVDAGRVSIDLSAKDANLSYDRDVAGRLLLLSGACRDGRLSVEISTADLESILFTQAKTHAADHGVTVTALAVDLKKQGERSISANVRVTAKKMLFSGIVHVTGRLDITDELNARLSALDVRGEGMTGSLAAGFLKPKLKQVEGREVPLAELALGGIRLRDIRIESASPLRLTASFGS